MPFLKKLFQLILVHKWKFALSLASAILFAFLLFPFSDLGDLVTSQVSKITNDQVYLRFDRLRMSLFPQPGVALDEVYLETHQIPPLKSKELIFTPSISSLISQKPAGTLSADGFLNGQIKVSLKPTSKSENGLERYKLSVTAEKISLSELRDLAQLPVMLKGQLNLNTEATANLAFQEQPEVELQMSVDKFELPSGNLQTMMGPLTLPELKLSSIHLKGRLAAGKFIIEDGTIGKDGDEVHGTVKGDMNLVIQNRGGTFVPIFGAYRLDIDLNIRRSFEERASLFLSFVSQYKSPTAQGSRYSFKINATNPQLPPNISALR
ncbi:MAG: type II secretion system protein GspN [Bdellovibrio sp. CG10_big_fil_rev_8_21_14_0_10_47_8]|nr:MAG: type II secretion system protein GspN [Bdellovibrio sp. CG10_big_fil_rev_8_21_14_0_10_47_8]